MFRHPDALGILSGKWIEVQCHLLLAHIYEVKGKNRPRDWDFHHQLEQEFEIAARLTDLDLSDVGPDGFALVYSSNPSTDGQGGLHNYLRELGYIAPSTLSADAKGLRAMVHHRYSSYLLGQMHREFDALKHEITVTQLLPEFGESFLNCATACLQIGDSERALDFAEQAHQVGPKHMDNDRDPSTSSG